MRREDRIIGLIWFALGCGMAIEAARLGLGEFRLPGIGFMGFVIGVSLGVSGLILTRLASAKRREEEEKLWAGQHWRNVVIPLSALFMYIVFVEVLGFLISTFLLIFLLFKMTAPKRWLAPLASSVIVVFLSYLVFFLWLKVPLPKGYFGLG